MGRPTKSPEDKMERMVILVLPGMVERIDKARGEMSRAAWIREALEDALHTDEKLTGLAKGMAAVGKPQKAILKARRADTPKVATPEPKSQEIAPTGIKSGLEKPIQTVGLSAAERAAEIKARMGMRTLSPGVGNPKTGKR